MIYPLKRLQNKEKASQLVFGEPTIIRLNGTIQSKHLQRRVTERQHKQGFM